MSLKEKAEAIDNTLAKLETELSDFLAEAEIVRRAAVIRQGVRIIEGDERAARAWAHVGRVVQNSVARGHARATGDTAPAADTLASVYEG